MVAMPSYFTLIRATMHLMSDLPVYLFAADAHLSVHALHGDQPERLQLMEEGMSQLTDKTCG